MKTTRATLINAVSEKLGVRSGEARGIVETIFGEIIGAVARGEKVELRGVGTFKRRKSGARRGRDFKQGRDIRLEPGWKVSFRVSRKLREAVGRRRSSAPPESGKSG